MTLVQTPIPIDLIATGPARPSGAWQRMARRWELPHALMGGTLTMRATQWLPQHPVENTAYYENRLERSTLTNFFGMAVKNLSGRPFAKPVQVLPETSPEIAALADNIDGRGQNLTQFARKLFEDALTDGMVHVLATLPTGMESLSLSEQRLLGFRPYLKHVPAPNLLSAIVSPRGLLERIVIYEPVVRPKGVAGDEQWEEETVHRYRVIWRDRWQLWERQSDDAGGDMVVQAQGEHSFGRIPLTTIYFNRKDDMEAWPPLENLAWTTLKHFQVSSDQDNVLHFVSVPILFGKGIRNVQDFVISAGLISLVDDENADLKYIEHSGGAIDRRRQQLEDLKETALSEAAEMLTRRPAGVTATAVALEFTGPKSWLEAMAFAMQVGLDEALRNAGTWANVRNPQARTNVFQEFGIGRGREDMEVLFQMARPAVGQRPLISDQTFLGEAKRRGFVEDTVSPKQEKELIDKQGPVDLGMPGAPGSGPTGAGSRAPTEDEQQDAA